MAEYVSAYRDLDDNGDGTERLVLRGPETGGVLEYAIPFPPPRQAPSANSHARVGPGQIAILEHRTVRRYQYPPDDRTFALVKGGEALRLDPGPPPRLVASDGRAWILPSKPAAVTYVCNGIPAPVLVGWSGRFRTLNGNEAREILIQGGWVSAVDHEATAKALAAWAGIGTEIPAARMAIKPRPGDRLLVVTIIQGPRPAEDQVLTWEEIRRRGFRFLLVEVDE